MKILIRILPLRMVKLEGDLGIMWSDYRDNNLGFDIYIRLIFVRIDITIGGSQIGLDYEA